MAAASLGGKRIFRKSATDNAVAMVKTTDNTTHNPYTPRRAA